jgi:3',5'-cyclic AMP phosphodiesterase CpdA
MFSFLHISDLHLLASETETTHGISPYQRLEQVINSIDKLEYPPSFAIITGDLSTGGTVEGYESVRRYITHLNEKGIQTMLTMGNNDDRENYRQAFQEKLSRDPIYYTEEYGELRIIILDTLNTSFQSPRDRIGFFEGEQLKWLSEVLNNDPARPTIIALHHPIYGSPHKVLNGHLFDRKQRDEFYKVVSRGNVLALFYGHLHHSQVTSVNGVLHVQAGSTVTELNINEEEYWSTNTASYNQIIFRDDMLFVQTITLPFDGRVLVRKPIQDLFG